jgi:hypothetical protein
VPWGVIFVLTAVYIPLLAALASYTFNWQAVSLLTIVLYTVMCFVLWAPFELLVTMLIRKKSRLLLK